MNQPQSPRKPIKAIIFDCYGVLTEDVWLAFIAKHLPDEPTRERAREVLRAHNRGFVSYEDFLGQVSELSGVSANDIDRALEERHGKNERLFELIRELRARYKIGMLSNVGGDWLNGFLNAEERGLFDAIVLSFDAGAIKPDPKAYLVTAERLEVVPEDCVFIDDGEQNCRGAEAVGMQAIHYRDYHSFKSAFDAMLASDSDNESLISLA